MLKCVERMSFWLMMLSLTLLSSSSAQSFTDTLMLANFTNSVVFPSDKEYRSSVVMANYDCKFLCPYVVLRPVSVKSFQPLSSPLISGTLFSFEFALRSKV